MRRQWKTVLGYGVLMVLLSAFVLSGCGEGSSEGSTESSTGATVGNTSTSGSEATTSAPEVLKIGVVAYLGWPIGLDFSRGVELMADTLNSSGGLDIGGRKYTIEVLTYDSNNDQATEVAAVNRLVYEDKVKFICTDGTNIGSWYGITEENHVVVNAGSSHTEIQVGTNYTFDSGLQNCSHTLWGWFVNNYPDKKTIIEALPDYEIGHSYAELTQAACDFFGLDYTPIFYPMNSQDLSAIGTKVRDANPDVFAAIAGGPILDANALKAAYTAGYSGMFFIPATEPTSALLSVLPAEAAEGLIGGAWPTEFDPAPTPEAVSFKEAYAAKYGQWDNPEIMTTAAFSCLLAALQKAGTTDVDAVANAIAGGLEYAGPTGNAKMVARLDTGNARTTESIVSYYIKQVKNGTPVQIGQMTLDEAETYLNDIFK